MANSIDTTTLVKAAEDFLASVKNFDGNPIARAALVKQADNLRYHSEDGFGTILRQFDGIHLTAAMNVLTSTGILVKIPTEGTISSNELAKAVNLDESVIQRAMRIVCAQGIGEERAPNVYAHNAKSLAYFDEGGKWFFKCIIDQDFALKQLPRYFKTHTRDDLLDRTKSPYAFAHNLEGKTYYETISADPERLEMFNKTLVQMEKTVPVLGMFPFSSLKTEVAAEPDRPFIVDVGGGLGEVLMSIQKEAPAGFGSKMILQDRPDVIDAIPSESIPHVTKMAHDFFTPQPVRNAHVYLLRRILHDFYDPVCIEIVKNIVSAMGPTSRLLIGDFVVPEQSHIGDDFMVYWMDFSMMMLTGQEKTASQFEKILNAAGLELVKIWPFRFGAQAIVEARLKAA
ncbi:hypothetical protein LTR08_001353 [Meristemomyces frigidus]|nr:hypothetical protein LTR08_001353 [Meristemomyces frigidus]